jgi:hypothetical protein
MYRYLFAVAALLALIGLGRTISARPVDHWSEDRL